MLPEPLITALHFARTRWHLDFRDRAQLDAWQSKRIQRFMRDVLPLAPFYRDQRVGALSELPIMDKAAMMADFEQRNTRGIRLEQALEIGLKAEQTRNFKPELDDLTVGLSSGTSGNRGVFLVSRQERLRWAGIILGRALPGHLLGRLLAPWQAPLRIAFFLRANSNLYDTLNNRRISFTFHDLLLGTEVALPILNQTQPDVLVGPPALLRQLADATVHGHLSIKPAHIISVADVLEDEDKKRIHEAFGVSAHQLYQATEGFLGYTCEHGSLHLNESYVHIEPEWMDDTRTRFQPIVTDFTRETQLIVRYRLNDILRVRSKPCPCGRVELAIDAIEGRSDETLLLPAKSGETITIYPDLIRRAFLLAGPAIKEFSLVQEGLNLHIGVLTEGDRKTATEKVLRELDVLWTTLGVHVPNVSVTDWHPPGLGAKRRRIHRLRGPEARSCTR